MNNLRQDDISKLAYIHSNRSITLTNFHKKFFSNKSRQRANQLLKLLELKGHLQTAQENKFLPMYWFLTEKGITELKTRSACLARNVDPVSINFREQDHHQGVVALRIALEADRGLSDVFFISDYEFRQGITPETKWKFEKETPLGSRQDFLHRWYKQASSARKRTPDGFFFATEGGKYKAFVLEYEHSPYSYDRLHGVVDRLEDDFPGATKLFVTRTPERLTTIQNQILRAFKSIKRSSLKESKWAFSHFEKAEKTSFLKAFETIGPN